MFGSTAKNISPKQTAAIGRRSRPSRFGSVGITGLLLTTSPDRMSLEKQVANGLTDETTEAFQPSLPGSVNLLELRDRGSKLQTYLSQKANSAGASRRYNCAHLPVAVAENCFI